MDSFISQLSLMDLMHIAVTVPKTLVAQLLMNQRVCRPLVSGCWLLGTLDGLLLTPITMSFTFCESRKTLSCFCEAPALLKLSCSDDQLCQGPQEGAATCSSHVTVVLLFFGAAVYTYMLPSSYHTAQQDMMATVFHTILTPELNPLIYSLYNKDVMAALRSLGESRGPWCDLGPPVVLLPPPDLLCHSGS
ncbi:Olfactory receptor 2T3 [Sciurus carolinensis]|uniref:Olfactory receptor 2T3 n=1 Tax=Sciurus carolinensis TaxID=30640 RepID=A0AA41ST30_SCICA|nr:Olfactory receptor 2T3 [Sciurus carolinensis]